MRIFASPLPLLVLALTASTALTVSATYFQLQEGSAKCFLEELAPHVLMRIMYAARPGDGSSAVLPEEFNKMGIRTEIKNPLSEKVFDAVAPAVGEVKYVSRTAGDHTICFSTNTSHWWPAQNKIIHFEFDVHTGNEATEFKQAARKEHVEAIQAAVARLDRRVSDVFTEYQYQKAREHRSRQTSESTNSRVLWWSVAQIAMVCGAGVWQVFYLRRFFTKRNIH